MAGLESSCDGREALTITELMAGNRRIQVEAIYHFQQNLHFAEIFVGQQIVDLMVGLPCSARTCRNRLVLTILTGQQTLRKRGRTA